MMSSLSLCHVFKGILRPRESYVFARGQLLREICPAFKVAVSILLQMCKDKFVDV